METRSDSCDFMISLPEPITPGSLIDSVDQRLR